MVKKRKRLPRSARQILIPLKFGVANVAIGAAGTATQPLIPPGTQNPLSTISTTMTGFAAPLTAVVGAGLVIDQLGALRPKKRKRR